MTPRAHDPASLASSSAGTIRVVNPPPSSPSPRSTGRARRRPTPPSSGPRAFRPGVTSRRPTGHGAATFRRRGRAHAEELALLETRNVGKPITDSRGEWPWSPTSCTSIRRGGKHRGATIRWRAVSISPGTSSGSGGGHRAMELSDRHHLVEDRARPGLWQYGGGETCRSHTLTALRLASSPSTRVSPKACSRSWSDAVLPSAPSSSSIPTSPR